jgi:hypothetical protein
MAKATVNVRDDGSTNIIIELSPRSSISVDLVPGVPDSGLGGSISSVGLHEDDIDEIDEDELTEDERVSLLAYEAGLNGLESMILACACAGVDITSDAFLEAIVTALDAIGNNS